MPTIRVDDDVFAALQGRARPFVDTPNSVLRVLLGLGERSGPTSSDSAGARRLRSLIDDGLLQPGARLEWRRRNRGETYGATVLPSGAIELDDGTVHATPSAAAVAVAGYNVNGWRAWVLVDTGQTLQAAAAGAVR